MKYKHILYLLLCIAMPLISLAGSPSAFQEANQQYKQGHYAQAKQDYLKLINGGAASAALYFNVGNACYKTDDLPSALWYYENARKLAPADKDINFNIRYVNLKTTDKIDEIPEFFLAKWWRGLILAFSISALSVLSIVCILLASGALIWYLFTRSVGLKKATFYTAIFLAIVGIVFIVMGNLQAAYFDSHKQAIVFSGTVTVKSKPGNAGKTLFLIHEGTKVNLVEKVSNQIRIRLVNGSEGWIGAGDVKEI